MTSAARPRHPYLDHPAPIPFAHRGGTAGGLENTAAAFRRAAALGYRYFETDVHTTADGRLVAFHDPTLDRVTDARGRIDRLPWAEVARARVAGKEPLPLFEDLLEEFPASRWNVDIKAEGALEPLVDLVRRRNAWDRVCVGSFSEGRVSRAYRLAGPRLATSYGVRGVIGLRLRSLGIPAAVRRGAVCAQVPRSQGGVRVVDRRFVREAHARGLQVHVWTVNDPDRTAALLDLGVDGIMTDHLEMLRTVMTDRGAWV
ncbi:glycerophosphodiester phosphodiesterase [Streptomyces sp. ICN441]|uniref:Glycerophosphodiester phosphodiesterase n=1 Tax=Streptomyces tirandamycinicus TaxID=2174846 RepID=A0A2S1SS91_9ACTN|nr:MULTISPECIES: glycerophosphodiester phosphodiesterase family protein [Streptomyces]AWI29276.1 glycerophosphodiester phosphodiesterase [Streptomyces tirandamycinicus]MCY0985427.1 glycerophosphodiester phosphodiesterase family protein [Streptomyces tirandamycinicus]NNJ07470.1 glycerophosphodiester phosphodiesterase [Streptomyces sp. PKU-MA01144]TFE56680.1 glycerophosphodiester phosphodiesterase [Streptomyces sp. ICN441]